MTGFDIEGPALLPRGGRRLAGATAGMAVGTALSRVTGLARVVAQTAALGGSGFADSYNLANTTPNIVTDIVIGGVLSATFVPVFVDHLATRRSKDAWQAISAVVTVTVAVLVVATAAFFVLAPDIIRLYTVSNHNPDVAAQQRVATYLLRWFVPQLTCYGLIALFAALLNSRGKFAMPMFVPIANNVVVIVVLAWFHTVVPHPTLASVNAHHRGLVLLAFGTTLGVIVQTFLLVPSLLRADLHLEFRWQPGHEAVRKITRLAGWTFGFVLANQVALFVVLALADGSSPGAVSAYTYAYQFFLLPYGIVAVSIMTAVAPSLAARWARRDTVAFRRRMAFGLRGILAIVIPSAVGMIVLAHPLIDLILFHGAESAAAANSTAATLAMFALGLPGFSTYLYMVRVLQSMQDTRTAFQLYLLENGVNIVLAVALVGPLGVRGLALSVSIAYTVAALAAMAVIRRRVGGLGAEDLGRPLRRVTAATAIMAVATVLAVNVTGSSSDAGLLLRVVFAGVVGVAVYLGSVVLLGGRAERAGGGGGGEAPGAGPIPPGGPGQADVSGPAESTQGPSEPSEPSSPVELSERAEPSSPAEPSETTETWETSDDLADAAMPAAASAAASVVEGFRGRLHDRIAGAPHRHLWAFTDPSDDSDDDGEEEESDGPHPGGDR